MKTCKNCYYFKQRRINTRDEDKPLFYKITCSVGTSKDDKICDSFKNKSLKDLKDIIEL